MQPVGLLGQFVDGVQPSVGSVTGRESRSHVVLLPYAAWTACGKYLAGGGATVLLGYTMDGGALRGRPNGPHHELGGGTQIAHVGEQLTATESRKRGDTVQATAYQTQQTGAQSTYPHTASISHTTQTTQLESRL